jgi:uncharacterized protein YjbI with pentapeptide repeats
MEQSDKAPSDNLPSQMPVKKRFSLPLNFAFLFIGILIGVAGLIAYQGYLPQITKSFYSAIWILFAVTIISFVMFFGVKSYITKAIFGSKVEDSGELLADAQRIADLLTERVADKILTDLPDIDRNRIKNILPRLANLFFWQKLRNWWWQWLVAIFVSLTGITGTLLLINQNELLKTQNKFIKEQSSLSEGARRSSLVFLMGEIMQAVNEELKDKPATPYHKDRKLSPQLIARIAALSHSLKPYRYLDGDTLITKPLSPERGQLLMNIAYLKLDSTETLPEIFEKSSFELADLKEAVLFETYLGMANLSQADLRGAYLRGAFLRGANLSYTDLREADLREADLTYSDLSNSFMSVVDSSIIDLGFKDMNFTDLSDADLSSADLSNAQLIGAFLMGADLEYAFLDEANFSDADLNEANLNEAYLTRVNLTNTNLINTVICFESCDWFLKIKKENVMGYKNIMIKYNIEEAEYGGYKAFRLVASNQK